MCRSLDDMDCIMWALKSQVVSAYIQITMQISVDEKSNLEYVIIWPTGIILRP
jgi:hypothetical protein